MNISKFFRRLSIIFFWVLLIFFILYLPNWKILPFNEKEISIFAWGDALDPDVLAEFERVSGIKIHLSFYASNEELAVKMKATGGEGYDLIMPSDYTVATLIRDHLLKPLDHSKLLFWNQLYPALLNHSFDPHNRYSIPFLWEVFGFGIDKRYFKSFVPSWRAIYDPQVVHYKIALKNDPVEAFLFAAFYLYGNVQTITPQQFQGVRHLLLEQHKWVEAYSDSRADYYIATGNCPLALSTNTYIKRIRNFFPYIDFIIPQEGSFVTIENFCLSKKTKKEKYVYQFLNYIYRKKSILAHYRNFLFFPAIFLNDLDLSEKEQHLYNLSREEFKKFHFIKNLIPQQELRDLWIEVKSF